MAVSLNNMFFCFPSQEDSSFVKTYARLIQQYVFSFMDMTLSLKKYSWFVSSLKDYNAFGNKYDCFLQKYDLFAQNYHVLVGNSDVSFD